MRPHSSQPESSITATVRLCCAVALCASLLVAAFAARNWPLLGDASLMRYVVFLMHHGQVLYKNIADINLPGTYAVEFTAMHFFGSGALGLRLYDYALLIAVFAAALKLASREHWFAGIFAGCLFALVHFQDGLGQEGQRDLVIAALLLWAYIALFAAARNKASGNKNLIRNALLFGILFGLALGITLTIKPVLLPLGIVLPLLFLRPLPRSRPMHRPAAFLAAAYIGLAIPPLCTLLWMLRIGAWPAFYRNAIPLMHLHASMGRQHLYYLLVHSISPLAALFLLWLVLQLALRPAFTTERIALLVGLLGTIAAYVAQGKGDPYQRYPVLAILLLLIGLDLDHALRSTNWARPLAIALCVASCFVLAPRLAWRTTSFTTVTPFQDALSQQLNAMGPAQLNGNVQCLDTFGGCIDVLYNMHLLQSTDFLYDCYLFAPPSAERTRYRAAFWAAFQTSQPKIVILTDQFCFGDPRGFGKLDLWPALAADLSQHYQQQTAWRSTVLQHWWSRRDEPTQFRIYVRKTFPKFSNLKSRIPNP